MWTTEADSRLLALYNARRSLFEMAQALGVGLDDARRRLEALAVQGRLRRRRMAVRAHKPEQLSQALQLIAFARAPRFEDSPATRRP